MTLEELLTATYVKLNALLHPIPLTQTDKTIIRNHEWSEVQPFLSGEHLTHAPQLYSSNNRWKCVRCRAVVMIWATGPTKQEQLELFFRDSEDGCLDILTCDSILMKRVCG